MKTEEIITKTAALYSAPLPDETMEFLRGIAQDYCKVKNYVYGRYSGIGSVGKLTPVYGVLNEMRHCGLRQQLELPTVYYELAIAEAVGDVKGMWGVLKNTVRSLINANENLSGDDRLYLRTVLKINSVFAAVLNRQEYEMPEKAKGLELDVRRLNNLLCRMVRRHLKTPKQEKADNFLASPNGYRSDESGLYLTSRTPRRRVFIPVKGIGGACRQLRIIIRENDVRITFPVDAAARKREDYTNTVYAYIGYSDMLTLSNGNVYGKELGGLVTPETERLTEKNKERGRIYAAYQKTLEEKALKTDGDMPAEAVDGVLENIWRDILKTGDGQLAARKEEEQKTESESLKKKLEENNLGRKKYEEQKRRAREKTRNFINAELNRMFREEKPEKIVITKPVAKNRAKNYSKALNRKMTRSFRGYIRDQIAFKCRQNTVELVEISSKGTGSVCSSCGSEGKRVKAEFVCEACGYRSTIAVNSARNIERIADIDDDGMEHGAK